MGLILKMVVAKETPGKVTVARRVDSEQQATGIKERMEQRHPGKYKAYELYEEFKFLKQL